MSTGSSNEEEVTVDDHVNSHELRQKVLDIQNNFPSLYESLFTEDGSGLSDESVPLKGCRLRAIIQQIHLLQTYYTGYLSNPKPNVNVAKLENKKESYDVEHTNETKVTASALEHQENNVVQEQQQQQQQLEIDEEEEDANDWLDDFYIFINILILAILIVVFSSPVRIVATFLLAITLLILNGQIAVFWQFQNNNNNQAGLNINGNNGHENEVIPTVQTQHNEDTPPTTLNILWTLFTSFFLSMIP